MLHEAWLIKNTVVLILRQSHCLYLMYSEVAWVIVFSGTQILPQIILDSDYLPDYFSVSLDYALSRCSYHSFLAIKKNTY